MRGRDSLIAISFLMFKFIVKDMVYVKETEYRMNFANGKLTKKLKECSNSVEMYMLYIEWKRVAHQESRVFRLINCDTVIKDLNTFIRYYKKAIKNSNDIVETANLMVTLQEIEKYKTKKVNKSRGGHQADETKKKEPIVEEVWSDWCEIPMHGFSINCMYTTMFGRQIRSDAYNRWLYQFRHMDIPNVWDYAMKYDIKLRKPLAIEMEFICIEKFDVDNFTKSLIDALFNKWGIKSDNNVHETICRKIGTCEDYEQGLIRFRVRNL